MQKMRGHDDIYSRQVRQISLLCLPDIYEMRPYVEDLRETLLHGTIADRRGFIRSFIKRIEVDYPQATIEYSLPMPQIKARTPTDEVLAMEQNGVAG